MKTCIKLMLLMLIPGVGMAQRSQNDSLKNALKTARTDSARLSIFVNLALLNDELNRDTALYYYEQAIKVAKKNNQQLAEAFALRGKGYMLRALGKFPESLACYQQALKLAEDPVVGNRNWQPYPFLDAHNERLAQLSLIHQNLGELMRVAGDVRQALFQEKLAKQLAEDAGSQMALGLSYMSMGYDYLLLKQPDSSLIMEQKAKRIFEHVSYKRYLGYVFEFSAKINLDKGNIAGALQNYHKAIQISLEQKNIPAVVYCYSDLTKYYLSAKQKDSSLFYAKKTLETLRSIGSKDLGVAFENIYSAYKLAGNADSIYKYQGLALTAKDSSFQAATKSLTDFQKLSFQAQIHAQELEKEKDAIQTKIRTYALLAGIGVLMLLAGIFYRNNRQKQKANVLLSRQKDEIEAQAREAQIEAALEKVRSRSLAMHKSDELQEVVAAVFDKLQELRLPFDSAAIVERVEGSKDTIHWVANDQMIYSSRLFVPYTEVILMSDMWDAIQNGNDFFAKVYSFEEKNASWKRAFENSDYKYIPEHRKAFILQSPFYGVSIAIAKHSIIVLSSFTGQVLTEPEVDVLKRMARVFEQAYVRFLDLQKAEAQAREAQIETALERVRSRTMAMQHSDELRDVIQVIFDQFVHLGLDINGAGFGMDYKESDDWNLWIADAANSFPSLLRIPYFDHSHWNGYNEARRKGQDAYANTLTFEEKNSLFKQLSKYMPNVTAETLEFVYSTPGYAISNVFLNNVNLYINRFTTIPFSDADNAILLRFGKVFEQTYTRFKDLEQAEAQAREAQIETALERVRSRTMAMQKSEELAEVIQVIYEQFVNLGMDITDAGFLIDYKESDDWHIWHANAAHSFPSLLHIPYFDHPQWNRSNEAKRNGLDFFASALTFEEKNSFFDQCFEYIPAASKELKELVYSAPGYILSHVFLKNVSLYIDKFSTVPFSDAENAVLKRFGKVFEQTYTRFKDLEQAEAQAREAQIEVALERIRSRTMAMQKSEELAEVIQLIFDQFVVLNFNINAANFNTDYRADNNFRLWIASSNQRYPSMVFIPYFDHPGFNIPLAAKDAGSDHYVINLTFSEKNQLWDHFFKNSSPIPDAPADVLDRIYNSPGYYSYGVLLKTVSLIVTNYQGSAYTEAEEAVIMRFGKVFEQTYTRFKDLEQAEEQARESQIQLGLERVRARTMAMQNSEELKEVIQVVFEQFVKLDFHIDAANFALDSLKSDDFNLWAATSNRSYPVRILIPHFDHPAFNIAIAATNNGSDHYVINLTENERKQWWDHFFKNATPLPDYPPDMLDRIYNAPGFYSYTAVTKTVLLSITNYLGYAYTEAEQAVVMRFAAVFEQTYTRFKDLEQAEEQARESHIQLGLERVRARTMAMQNSEELKEVIQVVFEQLVHLGIDIFGAGFTMDYKESDDWHLYAADVTNSFPTLMHIPHFDHPYWDIWNDAKRKGLDSFGYTMDYDEKNRFSEQFGKYLPGLTEEVVDLVYKAPGYTVSNVMLKNVSLYVFKFTTEPYSDEENAVLMRFGKVFEQTYTRFKDLEQAEAQARESKIEAALERIRSRTMAMQKSDELGEVIQVIFEQYVQLNFHIDAAHFALDYRESNDFNVWVGTLGQTYPSKIFVPYFDHPIFNIPFAAKNNGSDHYETKLTFSEKNQWWDHFFKNTSPLPDFPRLILDRYYNAPGYDNYGVLMKTVSFSISNYEGYDYTETEQAVVMRFGKVFEQTYTRFKDLEQAEAQARESKIEAALERVRSRTMAMQKSEELVEVIQLIFNQFVHLGFNISAANFSTDTLPGSYKNVWLASSNRSYPASVFIPDFDHPVFTIRNNAIEKGSDHYVVNLTEVETKQFWTHFFKNASPLPDFPADIRDRIYNSPGYYSYTAIMKSVSFTIVNYLGYAYTEAEQAVVMRFGKVFDQTYTRFKDLEQAEEQAREAKIEAALEKVRSRSLAMNKADELHEIVNIVFEKMVEIGFDLDSINIAILDEKTKSSAHWIAVENLRYVKSVHVPYYDNPINKDAWEAFCSGVDYFAKVFSMEEKNQFYSWAFEYTDFKYVHPDRKAMVLQTEKYAYSIAFGKVSFIQAVSYSGKILTQKEADVLKRFERVFEQAYVRFQDLQKAEERARETVKQASLDRVRGEIASMRTTKDLERIIPLVWNELTILGIPFIRCGVFIGDEQLQCIHTHLSTPDGRALATFDLPFEAKGIGEIVLPAWRNNQIATVHWTAEQFAANTKSLLDQGAITSNERYVTEHPDSSLDLHFFPFLQGMLYVGNLEPLKESEKDLVLALAEAFSTAYARYEDFNKLEAAKQQVDHALAGLKSAQTQLIQNEKMASLGELTAGIAHEIQNPLNFVNNFSEVSVELLTELKEEEAKGNTADVIAIANDLTQNLEKIRHHGKRAEAIVKGMLEHSRSATGQKEPTDINQLADEYIRLSYHGLRAKDKSFNADLVTHFDSMLPKVNAIPQDIGRVLLNLFNNAFYAVNQKAKTAGADYKPEVSVTTSTENEQVIIKVKDNGIGIPDTIKEKIMQPFFTTKPTGEGTGLGLSLTYDMVVKGHGGAIDIDSKEGVYTEFTITLPAS